jgi:competence protein ComEA
MGTRPGRRSSAHEEAVARRLGLLGAELATFRHADPGDPPTWDSTHTRIRPGRTPEAEPDPPPPVVPVPGRHASRGGLTLGVPQLAVVAVVVLLALGGGSWWLLGGGSTEMDVPVTAPASGALVSVPPVSGAAAPSSSATAGGSVTVDVAGKVRRPGIAVLDSGSRVADALEAAGGPRPGVDLTDLNLARVLVDGEQILVGVPEPPGVAASAAGATSGVGALVDLNTADQTALESLPSVGPVTAQAILAWRTEHGGFTSVDQLLDVDGIGEATLAQLTPYVTL